MTQKELLQTLEFNLYILRAYNVSGYEREQAIKQTKEAINDLREANTSRNA